VKVFLTIMVVALLGTAVGSAGATTSRSGLRGAALLDPGYPVCKVGMPCTRPAAHALLRFWRNGRLVAHTRADVAGRYRIALPPRAYTVTSSSRTVVTPARIVVASDRYRRVTFRLDTGIR
jgi:hypothetical protein